jgi:RND family efflux transporter MFP subunit
MSDYQADPNPGFNGPPPGESAQPAHESVNPRPIQLWRKLDRRLASLALVVFVSLLLVWRSTTGHAKPHAPEFTTANVAVAKVIRADIDQEVICDAELRPFEEIDLHAKVAGYLENITVDIGDTVRPGQLLATIEVPELRDEIKRAEAATKRNEQNVHSAQAAYDQAHLIFTRIQAVDKSKPNLIAQQEIDNAFEKDSAAASTLAAAQSDVEITRAEMSKLQTMLKYSQITAPFAGVVTERYADPGALIQAGTASSTQSLPLVRLSQNDRLRLDIPVSVSYVSRVNVGDPVEIRIPSLEKSFAGTIARSSRKVESATRTMKVEVDVPNSDLKLIPGMYASVLLHLDRRPNVLVVPVQGVSRAKFSSAFVVDQEGRIEERPVTLGLETPEKIEVLSGLREGDLVMIGSRTQFKPGQIVHPTFLETAQRIP